MELSLNVSSRGTEYVQHSDRHVLGESLEEQDLFRSELFLEGIEGCEAKNDVLVGGIVSDLVVGSVVAVPVEFVLQEVFLGER